MYKGIHTSVTLENPVPAVLKLNQAGLELIRLLAGINVVHHSGMA